MWLLQRWNQSWHFCAILPLYTVFNGCTVMMGSLTSLLTAYIAPREFWLTVECLSTSNTTVAESHAWGGQIRVCDCTGFIWFFPQKTEHVLTGWTTVSFWRKCVLSARCEVVAMVLMRIHVFWNDTRCWLINSNWCFGGRCFRLEGLEIQEESLLEVLDHQDGSTVLPVVEKH
jgi:hypothetical protein